MNTRLIRALLSMSLAVAACGDDDEVRHAGTDGGPGTGDASIDASAGDGSLPGTLGDAGTLPTDAGRPFVFNDAGQVLCGTSVCACSNGVDEDSDGLFDQDDPECVSPWDNDEATFATGIAGDNRDEACQDCFFDGNSGSGDDGCRTPTSCLTLGNASSGSGNCNSCAASDQCKNFCQSYAPNGCDCFGCCSVQLGSNITQNVLLSAGCNIDGNDLSGCTQCIPSTTCVNTCSRCELCPGKTLADLPADCATQPGDAGTPGTPVPACETGASCGVGLPACTDGKACTYGCCVLTPVI